MPFLALPYYWLERQGSFDANAEIFSKNDRKTTKLQHILKKKKKIAFYCAQTGVDWLVLMNF